MGYTQTPPTWHLWCGIWASSCCSVSCKSWQSLPCSPKAKACIRLKRKTMGVSLTSMKPGPENQCEQKCLGVSNPAKRCTRMEWPQQKLVTRDMWWWWWYIYIYFSICAYCYILQLSWEKWVSFHFSVLTISKEFQEDLVPFDLWKPLAAQRQWPPRDAASRTFGKRLPHSTHVLRSLLQTKYCSCNSILGAQGCWSVTWNIMKSWMIHHLSLGCVAFLPRFFSSWVAWSLGSFPVRISLSTSWFRSLVVTSCRVWLRDLMFCCKKAEVTKAVTSAIHPGRLTWNIIIEVWKIMFLSKWVICMFMLIFQGVEIPSDKNMPG